jgi:hypothetical protein
VWELRLTNERLQDPLREMQAIVEQRRREADEFYEAIHPPNASADEKLVQRQALAGMLWTKQIYLFDVHKWLEGDNPGTPPPDSRNRIRNSHWKHLNSMRILSMPDKWEYPWFAAWDLAFHCVAIALVDPFFAKENLWVLLFEQFQHPNGQIPAYEWEFSDLNPPVHAWACWRVYNIEKDRSGHADTAVPGEVLPEAADQLRVVGQQGRQPGHERVRRRVPPAPNNITVVDRSEEAPDGAIPSSRTRPGGWVSSVST